MVRVVLLVVLSAAGCGRPAATGRPMARPPKLDVDLAASVGSVVEVTGRIDVCEVGGGKADGEWAGVDVSLTLSCERAVLTCALPRLPKAPAWFGHDLPGTLVTVRGRVESAAPEPSGTLAAKLADCEVVREPWRP